jgi:hypothetical protein
MAADSIQFVFRLSYIVCSNYDSTGDRFDEGGFAAIRANGRKLWLGYFDGGEFIRR